MPFICLFAFLYAFLSPGCYCRKCLVKSGGFGNNIKRGAGYLYKGEGGFQPSAYYGDMCLYAQLLENIS